MADISTAVSMARVPILGENGRISDDYIPAAIGENVTKAESAATRAETAATGAEGSASAASQSAAQASGSASAASASASQAQQSATTAGGAATSAQSAQTAAEAAKTAAETAQSAAAGSAQDARQSATAAQQSAASVADKFIASAQATTLEPGSQATASVADQVLTIGVPKGDTGAPGVAATIAVGNVSTLPAGSEATVENTGTGNAAVLTFGIPKGETGEPGYTPQRGVDYWTASDRKPIDDAVRRANDAADAAGKYLAGEVTGVNVTADDSYGGKPLGVVINGNSVNNLLGKPGNLRSNGITLTKNANGSYHVSGTSTAEAVFYFSLDITDLKIGDKFSILGDSDMSVIGDIQINAFTSSNVWSETLYAYSNNHTLSYTFGPRKDESVRTNLAIVINEGVSPDTDIAITIVEGDIVPDRQYPSGVTKAEPTALLIGPLGNPERVELPGDLTLDNGDYVSIESDGKVTATVSGEVSAIGTVELPELPRGSFEASAESNIPVALDVSYIRDMDSVVLQTAGFQRLWSGKKVVLIGTSVGFGSNAETNYITEASKYLGFSFVNASVPGQAIHTQADGRPMTYGSTVLSVEEYKGFGITISDAPIPDDPGGSYNNFYRTWENVFSEANKDADMWLYAVAPNNTNFATSDWDAFDKSSWRYSDGSSFDEHRTTFIGALLFLMDKMYALNPEARMAFVLDSAFAYGTNEARGNIETVAEYWQIPVIDLYGSANISPKSLLKLKSKGGTDNHPSTFGQGLFGRMLAGRLTQFA